MKIPRLLFALLLIIGSIFTLSGCRPVTPEFTPWMNLQEFSELLNRYEKKEDGMNYWSQGHWVTAVEGRWEAGKPEFRIQIGDTPKDKKHWWYWWFNQSQEDFNKRIHDLSNRGFTLVQHNEFKWPDGSTRYSGVWHKTE